MVLAGHEGSAAGRAHAERGSGALCGAHVVERIIAFATGFAVTDGGVLASVHLVGTCSRAAHSDHGSMPIYSRKKNSHLPAWIAICEMP
jgi:hypothetical protein